MPVISKSGGGGKCLKMKKRKKQRIGKDEVICCAGCEGVEICEKFTP
jgi:hypothetical protein